MDGRGRKKKDKNMKDLKCREERRKMKLGWEREEEKTMDGWQRILPLPSIHCFFWLQKQEEE